MKNQSKYDDSVDEVFFEIKMLRLEFKKGFNDLSTKLDLIELKKPLF